MSAFFMRQRFSTETDFRDYIVWNNIERPEVGPQGEGQGENGKRNSKYFCCFPFERPELCEGLERPE
ncbi:hypothetical protein [Paraglaciecola hydrolytica]|uniref:hypothetical protein n=1 Tax=Paraglaciecola hydrolytica TaxID=1799789 RepID=UPI001042657F|nr:hypothetical protein [Paraglaciecola hydrolytica]